MNKRAIGMFDSGVGGLTVVREVINHLPKENIIYLGDTARFPYGSKTADELKEFSFQIIEYLKSQQVKLIVVACNSASAAALGAVQENFDLPIVGVIEPGARGAVLATRNRKVGVVGTKQTIASGSYVKAIHAFDAGVEVNSQACPPFADLVEEGETSSDKTKKVVGDYLKSLIEAQVDTLILGCTHYPLLKDVISEVMGEEVTLISSDEEIAKEVEEILVRKDELREESSDPNYRFLSTGDGDKFLKLGKRFLGSEISNTKEVSLDELRALGGKFDG